MERLMRSNSKNNGIGAKNNKTLKQEQSPKGISKNVKTAIRKMKTAIKRHVIGSCSSVTRGPPESEVKNNSTLKRKAYANMQKESPTKRNNRQTSAVSKDISNTSGHAPASSSEKASKKKTDNSKGTGKILKRNKKVDKSKIINIKNAVKIEIPIPSCSTTNTPDSRNKWLKKRMEKEQLQKNITPPEVKTRYSAKGRLQQLRDRLSKEAESETSALAEPIDIRPNIAVPKPVLTEHSVGRVLLRERQPVTNGGRLTLGRELLEPAATNVHSERLAFGREQRNPAATNVHTERLTFGRELREPAATNVHTERLTFGRELREPAATNVHTDRLVFGRELLKPAATNVHTDRLVFGRELRKPAATNVHTDRLVFGRELRKPAATNVHTDRLVFGRELREPAATNLQMEQLEFGRGLREPTTNIQMDQLEYGWEPPEPATNLQMDLWNYSPTTEFGSGLRQPTPSLPSQSTGTNVQNYAERQPVQNTHVQNSAVQLPLLNFNVNNSASGQSSTSRYVQNNTTVQPLPNTFVRSNTAARTNVQPNTSAQVQLPVFQEPLSYLNEINAIQSTASTNMQLHTLIPEPQSEDMDVDDDTASPNPFVHSSCPQSEQRLVIVIDTNVFIHNLTVIKHILSSYFIGFVEKPSIVIPWRVINELDCLKDNKNKSAVQRLANDALNYLYEMLPKSEWIKGQTVKEAEQHLFACEVPDDDVLNCCLQQTAQGNSVILLTNDKNLCNKCTINGIKNMSSLQLEKKLEDRLFNYVPGELIDARYRIYKANIYNLLSTILRNEMQRVFEENWTLIIYINPPWSLMDVLNCIIHHWIAVFDYSLPRIKNSIIKLKNILSKINETVMAELTDHQVGAFQEICVQIAHTCQIVADYVRLASDTVKAIKHCPHMDIETMELRQEKKINDVFHNMYTYVSSYCAKVCVGLRVNHNLEDRTPTNESLDELLTILPLFNRLVNKVTQTLLKLLNADADSVLLHLTNLNSVYVEINETFAFLNISEISPTYYFAKCRDLFLIEYKAYSHIGKLLHSCLEQKRLNTLSM